MQPRAKIWILCFLDPAITLLLSLCDSAVELYIWEARLRSQDSSSNSFYDYKSINLKINMIF